jgi:hypothetical protein
MAEKEKTFQDKLIHLQGLSGLTQEQAAKYLEVHINTYKGWFLGKMVPRKRGTVVFMEDVLEKMEKAANQAFIKAGQDNSAKLKEKD